MSQPPPVAAEQGEVLRIDATTAIRWEELRFRYARASGPGGQNVNRSATKVELLFDVAHSPSLSELQRGLVRSRLAGAIDGEGVLHLFAQSSRSQLRNRQEAVARLARMLAEALEVPEVRRRTRPTRQSRERRHLQKRSRSHLKRLRQTPSADEG